MLVINRLSRLRIAPPFPALLPLTSVNLLIRTLSVKPSSLASSTLKIRDALLPSMVKLFAPKPKILRLLSIANSPKVKVIVPPLRLESKLIVPFELAIAIASRKDKSPSLKSPSFSSSRVETTSWLRFILPIPSSAVRSSNAPISVCRPIVRSNPSPL